MIEDKYIQETAHVMQSTMLDVLQRRSIIQGLEEQALRTSATYEATLVIIGSDYLRAQLSDLRKLFDRDNRVYRIADLTAKVGAELSRKHTALSSRWEEDFKGLANKYFFHLERDYSVSEGVSRSILDTFIDDSNEFLNELVSGLTKSGYSVGYIVREVNSDFFREMRENAIDFFQKLGG